MRRPYPVIYESQILWHAVYFYGNIPVSLEQSNGFQSISNQRIKYLLRTIFLPYGDFELGWEICLRIKNMMELKGPNYYYICKL